MSDEDGCPGGGKCHGCTSWCSWCGNVSRVCDDPWCDTHRRLTEIEASVLAIAAEIREAAAEFALYEAEFRQRGEGPLRIGGAMVTEGYLESRLSKAASEIRALEKDYLEEAEELGRALLWEAKGVRPVPRKEPHRAVPEQLELFPNPEP